MRAQGRRDGAGARLRPGGARLHRALGVYGKLEAGSPQALNFAIHCTRKGGVISVIGAYGPPGDSVDIGTYMNKAQRMNTGQASVKRYMPHLRRYGLLVLPLVVLGFVGKAALR